MIELVVNYVYHERTVVMEVAAIIIISHQNQTKKLTKTAFLNLTTVLDHIQQK